MSELTAITPYLYVPFAAWAVAQVIKFALALIRGEANIRYLYASGGMPSVHSAVVCSLATWALIEGGPNSSLFGFSAVFAAIVMYDSFGVRRSAGDQARTLNRLIADLSVQGNLKNYNDYNKLREILGHRPLEVIVGAGLGIIVSIVFGFNKLSTQFLWLTQPLDTLLAKWGLIFAGIVMISVPALYIIGMKKFRKKEKLRSKVNYLVYGNAIFGLVLAISCFLSFEQINSILAQNWFFIATILIWLVYSLAVKLMIFKQIRQQKPEQDIIRKQRWLKKSKKTRKKTK